MIDYIDVLCEACEPWAEKFGWDVRCELPEGHSGNHKHGMDVWFRQPVIMELSNGSLYVVPRIDEGGWPTRDAAG